MIFEKMTVEDFINELASDSPAPGGGSVAALCAVRLNPACRDWLLFAHSGAEPGHRHVLEALAAQPLLDLGLRLGEGSGAALAVPLLRQACALHAGMATFAEAAVSDRPA